MMHAEDDDDDDEVVTLPRKGRPKRKILEMLESSDEDGSKVEARTSDDERTKSE